MEILLAFKMTGLFLFEAGFSGWFLHHHCSCWNQSSHCINLNNHSETSNQAPVVQMSESAIHRINNYLVDKYLGNQLLHHPLDRDLSIGWCYPPFEQLGPNGKQPWDTVESQQMKPLIVGLQWYISPWNDTRATIWHAITRMCYWPSMSSRQLDTCQVLFFGFLWPKTKLRSVKMQIRTRPLFSHLDQTSVVNKGVSSLYRGFCMAIGTVNFSDQSQWSWKF